MYKHSCPQCSQVSTTFTFLCSYVPVITIVSWSQPPALHNWTSRVTPQSSGISVGQELASFPPEQNATAKSPYMYAHSTGPSITTPRDIQVYLYSNGHITGKTPSNHCIIQTTLHGIEVYLGMAIMSKMRRHPPWQCCGWSLTCEAWDLHHTLYDWVHHVSINSYNKSSLKLQCVCTMYV